MTERLLQFIWQFQYFNQSDLFTEGGTAIKIVNPGLHNTHQGPDFLEAGVQIDGALLVGSIELHLLTSGWKAHGHEGDAHYRNVVLHVVWEHDLPETVDGIPVLVLKDRVPKLLLQQYETWMMQQSSIPCGTAAAGVRQLVWSGWTDRLLAERLTRKSGYALQLAAAARFHWEETCWQLLARNFGTPVNADCFEQVARVLPLSLLKKHRNNVLVLEALLMGQAGLLEQDVGSEAGNAYAHRLRKEYQFYRHKYRLPPPALPACFLRMRPVAFPTVRLAQAAMLLPSLLPRRLHCQQGMRRHHAPASREPQSC